MEKEIKLVFGLILYFLLLTFIITMITAISDTYGLDTDGYTTVGQYNTSTADFRTTSGGYGERFEGDSGFLKDQYALNHDITPKYLIKYDYIYDETSCLSYNNPATPTVGFEWVTGFNWFWQGGTETCEGKLDLVYWDNGGTFDTTLTSVQTLANDEVCSLGRLQTNTPMFKQFGCNFEDPEFSIIWESLKDMATLDIDFGFEKPFINFTVNFLVIVAPFLLLFAYVIVIIRKLVGFT